MSATYADEAFSTSHWLLRQLIQRRQRLLMREKAVDAADDVVAAEEQKVTAYVTASATVMRYDSRQEQMRWRGVDAGYATTRCFRQLQDATPSPRYLPPSPVTLYVCRHARYAPTLCCYVTSWQIYAYVRRRKVAEALMFTNTLYAEGMPIRYRCCRCYDVAAACQRCFIATRRCYEAMKIDAAAAADS